jgi:hypothetical protein
VGRCELTTPQRLGTMERNWEGDHDWRRTIVTYRISLNIKRPPIYPVRKAEQKLWGGGGSGVVFNMLFSSETCRKKYVCSYLFIRTRK